MRRPCKKKDVPRRVAWDSAKTTFTSSRMRPRLPFYSSTGDRENNEMKMAPAPVLQSPEEREFVVDSGASMHMMSKKDSSSDEQDTLRRSRNPTVVLTANGEVAYNTRKHKYTFTV